MMYRPCKFGNVFSKRNSVGSIKGRNQSKLNPFYKLVNGSTGQIFDSENEQNIKKKLLDNQLDPELLMKDPYFELLEGIKTMKEYFPTKSYYVETTLDSILELEEIKREYYLLKKKEFNQYGYSFSYKNEIRLYLELLEIVKIRSLNRPISLLNKSDLIPLYREVEKIVFVTDEKNKVSYNRLPYDQTVIDSLKELKKDIETYDHWIFLVPEEKVPEFHIRSLSTIASIIQDVDNYQNRYIVSENKSEDEIQKIKNTLHTYKSRT